MTIFAFANNVVPENLRECRTTLVPDHCYLHEFLSSQMLPALQPSAEKIQNRFEAAADCQDLVSIRTM